MPGFVRKRNMKTNHIGIPANLFQVGFFYTASAKTKFDFIISQYGYIKSRKQFGKTAAGISITDNTDSFTCQFSPPVFFTNPFAVFYFFKTAADLVQSNSVTCPMHVRPQHYGFLRDCSHILFLCFPHSPHQLIPYRCPACQSILTVMLYPEWICLS